MIYFLRSQKMKKIIFATLTLVISLSFIIYSQTTYATNFNNTFDFLAMNDDHFISNIDNTNPECEMFACCSDFETVVQPTPPTTSTEKPTGSLHIVINKAERKLYLYSDGEVFKTFPVAVGTPKTPTPVGEWKVVSKGIWGGGFGTRWMGLNIPWGIYGIHGTNKPDSIGSYASHGCIRMFNRDVEELYPFINIGTPVIIEGSYTPLQHRTITPGMASTDMLHVQERLRELGMYWGPIDGRHGKMTTMAITYFQLINNKETSEIVDTSLYEILQLK